MPGAKGSGCSSRHYQRESRSTNVSLVSSLLQAIVQADGDGLVVHAGETPYVVAPGGEVDIGTHALTADIVDGLVAQLLPDELRNALDDLGSVRYELPAQPEFPEQSFSVVATCEGGDLWVEIRRRRVSEGSPEAEDLVSTAAPVVDDGLTLTEAPLSTTASLVDDTLTPPEAPVSTTVPLVDDTLAATKAAQLWPHREPAASLAEQCPAGAGIEEPTRPIAPREQPRPEPLRSVLAPASEAPRAPRRPAPMPRPVVMPPTLRNPVRGDAPPPAADDTLAGMERLLRGAAARGASTLYLSTGERPSVRVDGERQAMDAEPALSPGDVVSLIQTLLPGRSHEALRTGAITTEWTCDVPHVGRVRCMSFHDRRGPGGVFRLMPQRVASCDELGLSREIQALAIEPEGLVLVVGPRSSGKRTLIAALVDRINRARRDQVITIEREVSIVHQHGASFISQREVPGSDDEMLAATRAALREDPDVLVLERIPNGGMMNVALEAAASGHLVIAGFAAPDTTAAIDRMLDWYAPEHLRQAQFALADNLRGVVAQVLLRRNGGGRVAAREVLLNTREVSSLIAAGKTSQLPMAIKGGRGQGMIPLADVLVAFVQNGTVDAREAYRRVTDRGAFLVALEREGVDTTFVERLA